MIKMKAKTFITIAIICQFLFSCKEKNTSCEYLAEGAVCITLKNRSGKHIKYLALIHERGTNEMANIADHANANISFHSPGENSYTVTATFEDGQTLKSNGEYIEGGYRITEIIHSDKIETIHNKSY